MTLTNEFEFLVIDTSWRLRGKIMTYCFFYNKIYTGFLTHRFQSEACNQILIRK